MEVNYVNFSKEHCLENEIRYFSVLEGVISSADDLSYLSITKNPLDYMFRISLSETSVVDSLIKQLNYLHNAFHIQCEFGKSSKIGNIFWKINLEN